jgi:hypothetical protein
VIRLVGGKKDRRYDEQIQQIHGHSKNETTTRWRKRLSDMRRRFGNTALKTRRPKKYQ